MEQIKGIHPICEIFPMMSEDSLAKLAQDIQKNGLVNPIVIHDGMILDGRNRAKACEMAGIEPRLAEWSQIYKGPMDVAQWVWSINVQRRHLTVEQIAQAIVARCGIEEREAAKARELSGKKADPMANSSQGPIDKKTKKGPTREVLAEEAGVSTYQVQRAMNIQKAVEENKIEPDVAQKIIKGTMTARQAVDQINGKREVSKHEKRKAGAATNRMVDALSTIKGCCRNLGTLDVSLLRSQSASSELREWAKIASSSATTIRTFAAALRGKEKSNE